MPLLHAFELALPIAYAIVCALYIRRFLAADTDDADSDAPGAERIGLYIVLAAHAVFFVLRGIELQFAPFGTKADFLSLVSLSIGAVYALVEQTQQQGRTGAFFLAPAVIGQSVASVLLDYDRKHALLLENPIYGVHVVFLVLGFTALAVGALYALMYVLLSRQLRSRELGVFFKRLPPLMNLDRMSKVGTVAGTILLGLGLGTGALLGLTIEGFKMADPKIVVSFVIWFGYLAGVGVARVRGMSGVQAAWATMLWFAFFLCSVGIANHSFA